MKNNFYQVLGAVKYSMKETLFWQGKAAYMIYDFETQTIDYFVRQENWLVDLKEQYLYLGVVYNDGTFVSSCTNFDEEYECDGCDVCDIIVAETYEY